VKGGTVIISLEHMSSSTLCSFIETYPVLFNELLVPLLGPTDVNMLCRTGSILIQRALQNSGASRAGTSDVPIALSRFSDSVATFKWALRCFQTECPQAYTDEHLYIFLAKIGQLDVLKWAVLEQGSNWFQKSIAVAAASAGHVLVLDWMTDHMPFLNGSFFVEFLWKSVAEISAENGHINVLEWLQVELASPVLFQGEMQNSFFSEKVCAAAAYGGQIGTLDWLRHASPSCPWDATSPARAAAAGHTNVLRWLDKRSCPIDHTAITEACNHNQIGVLKYLYEDRVPPEIYGPELDGATNAFYVYDSAIEQGNLEVIEYMTVNTTYMWCQSIRHLEMAARCGNADMLIFLHRMHYSNECHAEVAEAACAGTSHANEGNLACFKYAQANFIYNIAECYKEACMSDNVLLISWIEDFISVLQVQEASIDR
jgi:hypothetical protein